MNDSDFLRPQIELDDWTKQYIERINMALELGHIDNAKIMIARLAGHCTRTRWKEFKDRTMKSRVRQDEWETDWEH